MAYVDHAFSISDEDIMMETSYIVHNRPPIKEIALAVALLVFGTLGIILGILMVYNRVGGDRAHAKRWSELNLDFFVLDLGLFFAILGAILFIPGFYYTRIAYYAYKGYKGFSFSNIPPV
ncbi:Transmembrane protein 230 [Vitis vinifera]|uniref:Transmembrane protein 230 n=1 Tax=Vitis vinifera TaxID=29760 RepID=A0A438D4C4_VITVI|nr:Transmembrane protein 230 [Vitis vinifera]RVW80676.1 Transmembrane protein 230 [Vitis vinifera]